MHEHSTQRAPSRPVLYTPAGSPSTIHEVVGEVHTLYTRGGDRRLGALHTHHGGERRLPPTAPLALPPRALLGWHKCDGAGGGGRARVAPKEGHIRHPPAASIDVPAAPKDDELDELLEGARLVHLRCGDAVKVSGGRVGCVDQDDCGGGGCGGGGKRGVARRDGKDEGEGREERAHNTGQVISRPTRAHGPRRRKAIVKALTRASPLPLPLPPPLLSSLLHAVEDTNHCKSRRPYRRGREKRRWRAATTAQRRQRW